MLEVLAETGDRFAYLGHLLGNVGTQHCGVVQPAVGEVTVAEIADRAGLTKRTFFNHFADKREVLFAGAQSFEASVVEYLTGCDDDLSPIDACLLALTHGSLGLSGYSDFARTRQELIASSPELQERDLIKMASLASAMAEALRQRHVPARSATLTASAAVDIFTTAYADWVADFTVDFHTLMQRTLAAMRQALGGSPSTSN